MFTPEPVRNLELTFLSGCIKRTWDSNYLPLKLLRQKDFLWIISISSSGNTDYYNHPSAISILKLLLPAAIQTCTRTSMQSWTSASTLRHSWTTIPSSKVGIKPISISHMGLSELENCYRYLGHVSCASVYNACYTRNLGALYPQLALTWVGSFISSVWDQRVCFRANPLLHQKHYCSAYTCSRISASF